jgi:hypothetical protein
MAPTEFLTVPVSALRSNPWNTNRVSVDHEAKIRSSIERNGLFKPIIVRQVEGEDGYEIIGGEHRWEQAVELGYAEVPICNLGYISEIKAKEIGVIDNARYGADDTLSFSELLKEIGNIEELQDFLPYGDADLNAIFSASSIALESLGALDIDEKFDADGEIPEEAPTKLPKTHTIMRFKVSLGDAERLTALIAQTQKDNGFTTADDMTNAGDALIHLLAPLLSPGAPVYKDPEDLEAQLNEALRTE